MRFDRTALISVVALAAAVSSVHAAGSVEVSFVEPTHYSDAGRDAGEARRNEETLARFLEGLGERYLTAGQVLKIDVLDVDLAGTLRPSRRGSGDIRILRGTADVPHIKMRYALMTGGQVVQSGEENVTDLNYLGHPTDYAASDTLRHEKRMLSDWFKARFVNHKSAAG